MNARTKHSSFASPHGEQPRPMLDGVAKTSTYRADIDGLRALAVLMVLVYHVEPRLLPGGFVGVDVFFVISGYLITGLIQRELARSGRFDLLKFTAKRSRRLLPALLATVVVGQAAALFVFDKALIRATAIEAVAAATFTSNVLFWLQAGYFDAASLTKPFLHTWSLGVEAQFYLLWPFVMLAAFTVQRLNTAITIAGVAIASVVACVIAAGLEANDTAFFLTPFRTYEFALGGALAVLPRAFPRSVPASGLGWIGIVGIVASGYLFSSHSVWPGIGALVPCIFAVAIIGSGERHQNPVLRSPLSAHIGRASYSIYLAHWPVIVFGRELLGNSSAASVALLLGSLLAGYAVHYAVERRFYYRGEGAVQKASPLPALSATAAYAAIATGSVVSYALNPVPAFNGQPTTQIVASSRAFTWSNLRALAGPFGDTDTPNILVVGDSQAGDLVNLMLEYDPELRGTLRTFPSSKGCQIKLVAEYYDDPRVRAHPDFTPATECSGDIEQFMSDERLAQADVIILAYAWTEAAADYLATEVSMLSSINSAARIMIVGKKDLSASSIDLYEGTHSIAEANATATADLPEPVQRFNSTVAAEMDGRFVDPLGLICSGSCNVFTSNGMPIYFDRRHYTIEGLKELAGSPRTADLVNRLLGPR